jgi:hypothetical protein
MLDHRDSTGLLQDARAINTTPMDRELLGHDPALDIRTARAVRRQRHSQRLLGVQSDVALPFDSRPRCRECTRVNCYAHRIARLRKGECPAAD